MPDRPNGLTYADAGVDIDAGEALVEAIKPLAKATRRPGAERLPGRVRGPLRPEGGRLRRPLAGLDHRRRRHQAEDRHRDRPATTGWASTWWPCASTTCWPRERSRCLFLDYFATSSSTSTWPAAWSRASPRAASSRAARWWAARPPRCPACTAPTTTTLRAFRVGAVNRDAVLPKLDAEKAGDLLIGLGSSGPHSNGYSLIRKIVERSGLKWASDAPFGGEGSLVAGVDARRRASM